MGYGGFGENGSIKKEGQVGVSLLGRCLHRYVFLLRHAQFCSPEEYVKLDELM